MTRSPDPIARFDGGWRIVLPSDNDPTVARRLDRVPFDCSNPKAPPSARARPVGPHLHSCGARRSTLFDQTHVAVGRGARPYVGRPAAGWEAGPGHVRALAGHHARGSTAGSA